MSTNVGIAAAPNLTPEQQAVADQVAAASGFKGADAPVGGVVQHDQVWLENASPDEIVAAHTAGQLVELGAPATRAYQQGSIQSLGS